jgi:hypothetical protein
MGLKLWLSPEELMQGGFFYVNETGCVLKISKKRGKGQGVS